MVTPNNSRSGQLFDQEHDPDWIDRAWDEFMWWASGREHSISDFDWSGNQGLKDGETPWWQ